jgi:ribonuclease HIII
MSNDKLFEFEKTAREFIQNVFNKIKALGYNVTPPMSGQYNFNLQIKGLDSNVNVLVYYGKKGNKILLQGNKESKFYQEISKHVNHILLNSSLQKDESDEPSAYIGVDESGKGDFFGPLIIAGFYFDSEIKNDLQSLGVQDSKNLSDLRVAEIAKEIKERYKDRFSIVQINPPKYNELYAKIKNLNSLLAWGHSRCIENILNRHKVPLAICDQFGNEKYILNALMKEGKQIELIQTTRAERFLGVAAASILARNAFIEWIKKTENELGVKIPKGASPQVKEVARMLIEKFGRDYLVNYVKAHFKTMKEI